jgi:hypothetical protein
MTGQEVLTYLLNKGVIHKIGEDKYLPTSKVAQLTANVKVINSLDIQAPKQPLISSLYPKEIREASEDKKVQVLLNYCNVPTMWEGPSGNYMVRSADITTNQTLLGKIYDPEVEPELLIKVIKDYYSVYGYPKSLKRFLSEGDFDTLYGDYVEGRFLEGDLPDNKTLL